MKKTYIQPSMKAYNVKAAAILAGSQNNVSYGGSNNGTDVKTAESKGFFDDWDD